MRANFRLQRLYIDVDLFTGAIAVPDTKQTHYLLHVIRIAKTDEILLFNGRDGEWLARPETLTKRSIELICVEQTRAQPNGSDLTFLFAPLKIGRMDYLIQKAVEMGAGTLQPVITDHTQNHKTKSDKIIANAIEAAEQCGVLAIPKIGEACSLEALLNDWPQNEPDRHIIFCDEGAMGDAPLAILQNIKADKIAVLIGPEGGFSDVERQQLHDLPFVTAIPLGPRILRADTAAVAALTLVQAVLGDWS